MRSTERFTGLANVYGQARPTYPPELVRWCLEQAPAPGSRLHLQRILPTVEHIHDAHLIFKDPVNHLVVTDHQAPMAKPLVLEPRFHLTTEGELFQQACTGEYVLNDAIGHGR